MVVVTKLDTRYQCGVFVHFFHYYHACSQKFAMGEWRFEDETPSSQSAIFLQK